MKKLALILSIFLIGSIFLSGCGNDASNTDKKNENQIQVYTTVYPLQYFAQQIGGEYVNVNTIYPPGADEHTFEPSQKDMMNLADADLFFYIGLGLEGFVDKASKTLENEDVKMIPAAEGLHIEEGTAANEHDDHAADDHKDEGEDEHAHGDIDPHVWLDPVYADELAAVIKNQLAEQMPEQKETFEKNYAELSKQLKDLDQQFAKTAESAKRKEIIVAHSAYSYWEKRYGIEQISISGLSTTNEPSQKELEKLIKYAKDEKIKYVLNEQNFNSKLADMVHKEIGGKTLTLHNLSVLTDEDLNHKETYFTLMERNIQTLEKALNE